MITRYSVESINKIFSDSQKFNRWLLIEKAVLRFLVKQSLLSQRSYEKLDAALIVKPAEILAEESLVKHDFVAFLNATTKDINIKEKKWIHYGLTTTDVVDTSNSIALKASNEIIEKKVYKLLDNLQTLAYKYRDLPQIGRTHGIHAEITSFGYKFAIFFQDIENWLEHFSTTRRHLECAMMSGSVGTCANTGTKLQEFIAEEFDLFTCVASTQVIQRERHLAYFSTLNLLGQTINKIATNLRDLARTEINEINELFESQAVGSSSMPHKKNPVGLENICGLTRLLSGYVVSANNNVNLWNERDISHSSVERVLLLDSVSVTCYILDKLNCLLENLHVNQDQIQENIKKTNGLIFSQTVMMKSIPKMNISREEIHKKIQKLANSSAEKGISFKEALKESEFSKVLSTEEIEEIFDPSYHLKYISTIYKKIFRNKENKECFSYIHWDKHQILRSIYILAERINHHYQDHKEPITVISSLNGALIFSGYLLPLLDFPTQVITVKCNLYRNNLSANIQDVEVPEINKENIKGKDVLVLEDLLDTGATIEVLNKKLKKSEAKSIKTCVLFRKEVENQKVSVDWCGLSVPNEWIAGFGLDSKGKYRNLDFLGTLKTEYQ